MEEKNKMVEIDINISEITYIFEASRSLPWHFERTDRFDGYWYDIVYSSRGKYENITPFGRTVICENTLSINRICNESQSSSIELPTKNYTIRFKADRPISIVDSTNPKRIQIYTDNPSKTESLFIKAMDINATKSVTYKLEIRTVIYKLLSYIFSIYTEAGKAKAIPSIMIEATSYINNRIWDESLSVNNIAAHLNLSPEYFIRLFKQTYDTTPKQYINRIKLNKAAEFLKTTNRKLSDIAEASGFSDMHHFNRSFRKNFGLSPKEYRQKYSEEELLL